MTHDIQSDHIVHHMPKYMSEHEATGGLIITGSAHSVFLATYILHIFMLYIYHILYVIYNIYYIYMQ